MFPAFAEGDKWPILHVCPDEYGHLGFPVSHHQTLLNMLVFYSKPKLSPPGQELLDSTFT